MEENKELKPEELEKAAGGSIIGCLFGSHNEQSVDSFPIKMKDGTHYFYLHQKCSVCGKNIYKCQNSTTGKTETIDEGEYNRMKNFRNDM